MKLILYASEKTSRKKLKKAVAAVVPEEKIEQYGSVNDLTHRLSQPSNHEFVTVLCAATAKDLTDLMTIQDLLHRLRLLLILPDQTEDYLTKGHSLFPRYIGYIDNNFKDVAAVLRKMLYGSN